MGLVFKQLLILYIFLIVGYVIGKFKKDKAPHSDILSVLIVNVFMPCKVFSTFSKNFTISYFSEKYTYLIASLILIAVLITVAFFASKLLSKKDYERKVYRYSFVLTNYSYLGYVLIENVFGETVLANFIFFAIPFIIYTYTFGYAMLIGGKNPAKRLLNPITMAILLGMIVGLTGLKLPEVILTVVSMGSACIGPLSMLLTGITLSTFALKELLLNKSAYIFSAIRLVVIPAIVYGICILFNLTTLLPMILMITCMPCGLNTIVFPRLINEDCKLGASLALITHVLAMGTLTLWLSLLL